MSRLSPPARFGVLATSLLLVAACAPSGPALPSADAVQRSLVAAARRGPGTEIAVQSIAPGPWKAIYVFGPYTPASALERCVGEADDGLMKHIDSRDDINLLVFVSARGAWSLAISRHGADFGPEALMRSYRPDARFVVTDTTDGSPVALVPAPGSAKLCA